MTIIIFEIYYRVCQKMTQLVFVKNFVKSPPNLIIFGTQITKRIEICNVLTVHLT